MNPSKKILVIEDEPAIQKAIVESLRSHDFEVEAALDAERGKSLIKTFKPDLILLDLILPGQNGFEFLKEVKASAETAAIPVVILTNLGDEEEIKQGMRLGAADFLIKADYDLSEVVKIINKYLTPEKTNNHV